MIFNERVPIIFNLSVGIMIGILLLGLILKINDLRQEIKRQKELIEIQASELIRCNERGY